MSKIDESYLSAVCVLHLTFMLGGSFDTESSIRGNNARSILGRPYDLYGAESVFMNKEFQTS